MMSSFQKAKFKSNNSFSKPGFGKKDWNEGIDMASIYEKATGKSIKGNSKRLTGLCPFNDHQDRTPSFSLYPETQSYYCFGCRRSGSASWFKKEMERIYGI